jgi:hypothetical protein
MRPGREAHPTPGLLRAYLDGELGWISRRRCSRHLQVCATCRAKLVEETELDRAAEVLLSAPNLQVDASEAWRRLSVLARSRDPGARPSTLSIGSMERGRRVRWLAGAGLAAGLAAVALGLLWLRKVADPRPGESASPALQDVCCWDLDGGGPGDDGVVTVTLPGQRVVALTVYEDENGNGSLTRLDPIRFASSSTAGERPSIPEPQIGGVSLVRDVCCADYDHGGPADDGVLTVTRAERVWRVVLYEDADLSRRFSHGDPVRWDSGAATR